MFTVNPAGLALAGELSVELEHAPRGRFSFAIGGSALLPPLLDEDYVGYGFELGLRLYTRGLAPRGFWLGPQLGFARFHVGNTSGGGVTFGALLGYNWIFVPFALSLGGGVRVVRASLDSSDVSVSGVAPQLRLAIGFGG